MLPPDLAFALLINRTTDYYQAHPPVYMTYVEHTHVTAPTLGRAQDINRSIAVRIADNFAVMQDLPDGGHRTGQAFPIVAYFDPLSAFQFSYFANLKRVEHHPSARTAARVGDAAARPRRQRDRRV